MEESRHDVQVDVHVYAACPLDGALCHLDGLLFGHSLLHEASLHAVDHRIIHSGIDGVGQEVVHILVEVDGSVSPQPLVRTEESGGPFPSSLTVRLQRQFLGHGILQLTLLHTHIVYRQVVDVHEHVVAQELIRCCAVERYGTGVPADVQSGVDHVSVVVSLVVGVGLCCASRLRVHQSVGESVLANPLVVGNEVEEQALRRLYHQAQLAAGLVVAVGPLAVELVLEESVLSFIEGSQRVGETVAGLAVVGCFDVAVGLRAEAQAHIGALIGHGVARIEAHHAALGVQSVERSLRSAQDVHAVELVEVGVKLALVHHRQTVDIHAHGRTVDARSDTAYVH